VDIDPRIAKFRDLFKAWRDSTSKDAEEFSELYNFVDHEVAAAFATHQNESDPTAAALFDVMHKLTGAFGEEDATMVVRLLSLRLERFTGSPGEGTRLLWKWQGRAVLSNDVFTHFFRELHKDAENALSRFPFLREQGLTPTEVVTEAAMQLRDAKGGRLWTDKESFFKHARTIIRHFLLDQADFFRRKKRDESLKVPVNEAFDAATQPEVDEDKITVQSALEEYRRQYPLHYRLLWSLFEGNTVEESAKQLGISLYTANRMREETAKRLGPLHSILQGRNSIKRPPSEENQP
jgi:hypothetical protein